MLLFIYIKEYAEDRFLIALLNSDKVNGGGEIKCDSSFSV